MMYNIYIKHSLSLINIADTSTRGIDEVNMSELPNVSCHADLLQTR